MPSHISPFYLSPCLCLLATLFAPLILGFVPTRVDLVCMCVSHVCMHVVDMYYLGRVRCVYMGCVVCNVCCVVEVCDVICECEAICVCEACYLLCMKLWYVCVMCDGCCVGCMVCVVCFGGHVIWDGCCLGAVVCDGCCVGCMVCVVCFGEYAMWDG